jgi:N-acetylglucosamine-6-phosphate deacetylase
MDVALRRAVRELAVPIADAARAAATTPARVLGLDDLGALAAGRRADLVVLDGELELTAVMAGGSWLEGRAPAAASHV